MTAITGTEKNSPLFSTIITDYWRTSMLSGDTCYRDDNFIVTVNPDLDEDNRVMVLTMTDGEVMVVLTPALADKLGLYQRQDLSELVFYQLLKEAGGALHGADYLFYFSEADKQLLLQENEAGNIRRLTAADAEVFAAFQAAASAEDLDGAYVELDHWVVFGAFEQNRLVCAASMYPWDGQRIADLGVLTLEDCRGKGYARKVVRSICKYAYEQGYEPQYRCQLDNLASVSLAKAAGVTLFGQWDFVAADSRV
ncbi:GNAT family N-acetyltransferase [Chitinophaga nivalis]|uniref:GNAT family N-acetyltransferase n=1 Tax=Chitinophaga nivalis TaxID=2991709 RepID=A0ABT3IS53_9BACT|nr:GNAT family N-acetyltransferase [Chitinophaga nivalis]MCW3463500.1 GNAT family N-acetyltransferase [Chitinophaga nivalis]MCW3486810.1 GNAT family N-acetyltransferase [Chitinophaga nivalis]